MRAHTSSNGEVLFYCPGCDMYHGVMVAPGIPGPHWSWNGSKDFPTLEPSILVQWHSLSEEGRDKNDAFRREHGRYMTPTELPWDENNVCHSFVRNGHIQFLADCTHALAGQTVELPKLEEA